MRTLTFDEIGMISGGDNDGDQSGGSEPVDSGSEGTSGFDSGNFAISCCSFGIFTIDVFTFNPSEYFFGGDSGTSGSEQEMSEEKMEGAY